MGRRVRKERGSSAEGTSAEGSSAEGSSAEGSSAEGIVLSPELVELLESGVSILVGTCDDELRPDACRGLGARVSADRRVVTVLLNDALAGRLRENLANGGRFALAFSRIFDHHSLQLKGRAVALRRGDAEDELTQQRYLVAFGEQISVAGMPRSVIQQVRISPCLAVDMVVDAVFDQTPGPRAGMEVAS